MIFAVGSIGLLFASLAVAEDKREALARKYGVHAPRRRIAPRENYYDASFVEEVFTSLGLIYQGPLTENAHEDFHKIEVPPGFSEVAVPIPKQSHLRGAVDMVSLWTHSTLSNRANMSSSNMMLTLAGSMLPIYNPVCKIVVSQRSKELFGDDNYHMVDPYAHLEQSYKVFGDFQVVAYAHTTPIFFKTCSSDTGKSVKANEVFRLYDEAERALDNETPGWQPYTALWR